MVSHNLRLDRGRADFDQHHVMSVTWLYDLPFGQGKKFMHGDAKILDTVLGGWSFQGFNSLMSGEPFSISSGAKIAQYGAKARAVLVSGVLPDDSLHAKSGQIGSVFFDNTSVFAGAPAGSTGMGRNHALNHANFRKLGSTSVGSTSILSAELWRAACCQTQSTATSSAIVSNGEAYRVMQFVLRAVF